MIESPPIPCRDMVRGRTYITRQTSSQFVCTIGKVLGDGKVRLRVFSPLKNDWQDVEVDENYQVMVLDRNEGYQMLKSCNSKIGGMKRGHKLKGVVTGFPFKHSLQFYVEMYPNDVETVKRKVLEDFPQDKERVALALYRRAKTKGQGNGRGRRKKV